jgi:hypothetical protein
MPDEWQLRFTGGEARTEQPEYRAATEAERAQCLTEGEPCKAVSNALAKYQDRVVASARHDSMIQTVMALVRLGEQGHRGVMTALTAMHGSSLLMWRRTVGTAANSQSSNVQSTVP